MAPENFNNHQIHETDPQHIDLQEFRQTFNDIRSRQDIGAQVTMEVAKGQKRQRTKLRRGAMGRAAREYAWQLEDGDPRKMYANVIGVVPDYLEAEHDLPDDHHRSFGQKWLSEEQWDAAKKHTIIFNDTLRDIVSANPHLQPEEVIGLVNAAAAGYGYSEENKVLLREKTGQVLHGMQHELAFKSVLSQLPDGFEVLDTTVTDDEHGADFMVRCPNGIVVSIDVKASLRAVEKALRRIAEYEHKYHTRVPRNEIVLWSGFDDEDFTHNSPWLPSQEAIERVLPHIISALLKASGSKQLAHAR